ncbi:MAG: ABC transporter substrate-binding protein [Proteobacteria bacterium]|nr:ABC transporter substrate-binding protein [Pseudomonadota bacterium]
MKRFLRVSMASFLLLASALAFAASDAPLDIVRTTTDSVLARVQADKDALRADPGKMYDLVSELIFPHFDFAIMAQWVLGDSWASADEATRTAFVDQFRKLLVRTYATALLEFSDQTIGYPDVEPPAAAKTATVKQEISAPGSASIPIVYRLHNKTGDWKVFDVSVDGVSLIKTYRASFAAAIKNDGLPALIQNLEAKNQQFAAAKTQ